MEKIQEQMSNKNSGMLTRLFFKLLPVQIFIVAMGSINSIVDGVIAGRFLGAEAVAIIGLYYSFIYVINAAGNTLLGGTTVLSGMSMGRGDIDKTRGIFSLNITATLAAGLALAAGSFIFASPLAMLLGARGELVTDLVSYIRGYAIGIVPLMLAQQIASFLQLERQGARGTAGIMGMIISNIAFDLLLVVVLDMGVWGLALATSISNWVYLAILVPYYLTERAQLTYRRELIDIRDLAEMIKIGVPGAMLVFCLAVRGVVLNMILLRYAGTDGLSAQSSFNMMSGLFVSFALGVGATVRMLASVFFGERDKDMLKKLMRVALTRALPLSLIVMAAVLALSTPVSALFFPDRSSDVFALTRQLFIIYSFCIPLIVLAMIIANYLQAGGHNVYVNILSVFDGLIFMVIPAALLAPRMGALGVWLANPIGVILTLMLSFCYLVYYWKHLPRSADEWLFLKPDFGVPDEDRLDITIHDVEEVVRTAEKVQSFCEEHGVDARRSNYSALCLEEMADNVVEHGFRKDNKKHTVDIKVIYENDEVLLRIKDDCIPYDPGERAALLSGDDPAKNIGLRMVLALSKDMSYYNMLGLNVLSVRI